MVNTHVPEGASGVSPRCLKLAVFRRLMWVRPKVMHGSLFRFQSVGQILLPSLLTDFVWSLLMKLSAPDSAFAFEAATLLKLTLECHAHRVTMVRGGTASGGARSCFPKVLFASALCLLLCICIP